MEKVVQIIPYFGHWPEWSELYFYSCGQNPMVVFIFYTDCPLPVHKYDNTIFIRMSLQEYCKLVSNRLCINYNIKNPYKLTDLKPFLGKIHEPEISEFDFWGFSDIDLVYGDLSIIINNHNLKKYDLITTHSYHIAGHFTICRNNDYYKHLCFRIKNWQTRLVDTKHFSLDEGEWSNLVYPNIKNVRRIYKYIFKPVGINFFRYMEFANRLFSLKQFFSEFYTSPMPNQDEIWVYDTLSGTVSSSKGELPYLHFLFFKKTPWLNSKTYWQGEYYKLNTDIEKYSKITIDSNGITGHI